MSEENAPSNTEQLFPLGKRHKLEDGRVIEIQKWSIETMTRVAQRAPDAVEKFFSAGQNQAAVAVLIPMMLEEITIIVAETIGWKEEDVKRMTFDDLLGVMLAIWDTCISGPMEKVMGLVDRVKTVMNQPNPETTTKP